MTAALWQMARNKSFLPSPSEQSNHHRYCSVTSTGSKQTTGLALGAICDVPQTVFLVFDAGKNGGIGIEAIKVEFSMRGESPQPIRFDAFLLGV